MSTPSARVPPLVEVRPEVVFLSELLQELVEGRLRIPRFQRPFVWRRDQMTDLLDSVYYQYPIGSLLVWETDEDIATLDRLGPFAFPVPSGGNIGYLVDGHQRLSTLAGALVPREEGSHLELDDARQWDLSWNMEQERFQHGRADDDPKVLFPLTALLDTLRFFAAADATRVAFADDASLADAAIAKVSQIARSFQHYRVPVVRIRQTGLSQVVEIFARLNSKGQAMSADQMVSALTYQQSGQNAGFELATEIDALAAQLGEQGFGDVDRTTILRAILANIDEDIYKTDWTRLTRDRREKVLPELREGIGRTSESLDRAVEFLKSVGVKNSRLLPYTMQLTLVSAFFDRQMEPSREQLTFLERWFWASSFSGWFGGANPSRVNSLISEFRRTVAVAVPQRLENFDIESMSLPFPTTFDMRSARTRTLLLVMLRLEPKMPSGRPIVDPWRAIAEKGPDSVGYVFAALPKELTGSPANRMIRPPGADRGQLRSWVQQELIDVDRCVLESHGLSPDALAAVIRGDSRAFVNERQSFLIEREHDLQAEMGVRPSERLTGTAPIDTE